MQATPPKEPLSEENSPEAIDQRLVKSLSHPLRIRILEVLTERVASPNCSPTTSRRASATSPTTRGRSTNAAAWSWSTRRSAAAPPSISTRPRRAPSSATGSGEGSPAPARRRFRRDPAELHGPGGGRPRGRHARQPRGHLFLDAGAARRAGLERGDGDEEETNSRCWHQDESRKRLAKRKGRGYGLGHGRHGHLRDRRLARGNALAGGRHSHSIVAGGFEEMSRATRLTSRISLMIRFETRSSRS